MNQEINQDFLEKLNDICPEVDKILREIRQLDIEVLRLSTEISPIRQQTLEKALKFTDQFNEQAKAEIHELVRIINDKHEQIMALSNKKVLLANQLYNYIDEPTQELDRDLQNQNKEQMGPNSKVNNKKPKRFRKQYDWQYDRNEPSYCYCRRPSFGSMVMCENPFCEKEWFHIQCIQEKNLGQKWYCNECRRPRPISRVSKISSRMPLLR